jgi:hypothetical protein
MVILSLDICSQVEDNVERQGGRWSSCGRAPLEVSPIARHVPTWDFVSVHVPVLPLIIDTKQIRHSLDAITRVVSTGWPQAVGRGRQPEALGSDPRLRSLEPAP